MKNLTGAYVFGDGENTRLCIIDDKQGNIMHLAYCYTKKNSDYPDDGLARSGWVYSAGYFDPITRRARFEKLLNYYRELSRAGVKTESGTLLTSRDEVPCKSLEIQFPLIESPLSGLLTPASPTLFCRNKNGVETRVSGKSMIYPNPSLSHYDYINGIWQIASYLLLAFVIGEDIIVVLAGHNHMGPTGLKDPDVFETGFTVGSGKVFIQNGRAQAEIHLTNFYELIGVPSGEVPPYSRIQVSFPRVNHGEVMLESGVTGLDGPNWNIGGPVYPIRFVDEFNIKESAKHFQML